MRLGADRVTALLTHGFSEYEARAYLALLDYPSLTAGALAKAAQLPRNRLYEVLESLQGHDLVDIVLAEDARRYRARPFSEYLERRAEDLRARIRDIEAHKSSLAVALSGPAEGRAEDLEPGATRALVGRRRVARAVDRLLADATRSILAVGSAGGYERAIQHVEGYLADARADDREPVAFEVHLPPEAAGRGGFERLDPTFTERVRWLGQPLGSLAFIVDERDMILIHPIPDTPHLYAGQDSAFHTTDPVFVNDHAALVRGFARASPARERLSPWEIRN